jgi:hypothetical protein
MKHEQVGINLLPMVMQKVGESVGVSEEMDKQILVIQVFQMFEAVDFSILGNCHQWAKSDRINREYDTAILDILRKSLLPQSNQFTESVGVLKSVGDHPALLGKPRISKTLSRERKRHGKWHVFVVPRREFRRNSGLHSDDDRDF